MVQLDRGLVEANWRVGIDRRLVGASPFDQRGRAIWPTEGTEEGGRNLELEPKCELELEREPEYELEPELEPELELELELGLELDPEHELED